MKRRVLIALVVAGFASDVTAQSFSAFAGRWRLTTSDASAAAPVDLLFLGPTPTQRFHVERRFKTSVETEFYSTEPTRGSSVHEARWIGAALGLSKPGSREEIWSVGVDDTLRIVASDQTRAGLTRTLTYRRVPAELRLGENLLDNPGADEASSWEAFGHARIDPSSGNPCFAVRSPGQFRQSLLLPAEAAGHFLVMVGSGSSERINADGAITGLPYLYGIITVADTSRILAHLQGMLARPRTPNEWVTMSGVFPVPAGARIAHFQLSQASARGTPPDGSAARFDDLGFYIFRTQADARAFVASWRGRR